MFCDCVRNIIDLYFRELNPWECVMSVDENTSIQARKRIAEIIAEEWAATGFNKK